MNNILRSSSLTQKDVTLRSVKFYSCVCVYTVVWVSFLFFFLRRCRWIKVFILVQVCSCYCVKNV